MKKVLEVIFSGIAGVILTLAYQHFFIQPQSFTFYINGQEVTVTKESYTEIFQENDNLQQELNILKNKYREIDKNYEELLRYIYQNENGNYSITYSDEINDFIIKESTNVKSDYLLDLVQPYESPYWFTEYNGQTFDMGGDSYTHGFTCMGYGKENEGNVIYFNLHGKYDKLSFISGVVHRAGIFGDSDVDCTVMFYADGVEVGTIKINPNDLPSEHEININKCKQLKVCIYDGNYVADGSGTYGFAEFKIFK